MTRNASRARDTTPARTDCTKSVTVMWPHLLCSGCWHAYGNGLPQPPRVTREESADAEGFFKAGAQP